MKLSFMTWVCPEWELDEIVEFASESAYDGVELRVDSGHTHGVSAGASAADRAAVVERFEADDVEIPAIATSDYLGHSDPNVRAAQILAAKENVELASDLGADVIRLFGKGDRESMTEEAADDVAAGLTEIGEFARDHDVVPLLETMHDIVQSPDDGRAVLDRVNTDCAGLVWNQTEISADAYEKIGEYVEHVHLTTAVRDPEPIEERALIEALNRDGYDGYLSLRVLHGRDVPRDWLAETGAELKRDIRSS